MGKDPGDQTDLCHDILVEGEGDVGAAALRVTPGCGRGPVGGAPALPLAEAGLDEAALVPDGDAGLPGWTLGAASLTVQAARFRSTPKLSETREGEGGQIILPPYSSEGKTFYSATFI